jgi:haloalkane dehalogenase
VRVLRTPDDQFSRLPDFDYQPHYADVGGLRMAYVEAGPSDGEPVLLLHGEPSWSFLYRTIMPVLASAGLRAIAPDLIGFGRSDKPAEISDHSYARHVEWTRALAFDALDLHDVTMVGQDWGGLIGLRLVAEHPERVARVIAANTGLPTGDHPMPDVWLRFREVVRTSPELSVSRLVTSGCRTELPPDVVAAYDAPFPTADLLAGPRAMPGLVPTTPDDPAAAANRAAWEKLAAWDKPFLVAFSDSDPITGPMAPIFKQLVPGAAGLRHPVLAGAGHFLQEDAGDRLAAEIVAFVAGSGEPGDLAHLVRRVESGDLVRLGEGRVVEHGVDQVVDGTAAAHDGLADVD